MFTLLPAPPLQAENSPPATASQIGQPWSDVREPPPGAFKSTGAFDYGDPTASEQAHLEAINRARLNPSGEAARLGIDLFEGVPSGKISGQPVQPVVLNADLLQATRLHSQDMIAQDFFSHYSLDGKSPFDRMTAAGFQYTTAGENIAFIGSTGPLDEAKITIQLHDNLFIDDGYPDRGHRVNILNGSFKEIGVGLAYGDYKGYTNSYMVTCDFGTSSQYSNSFILGVVYDDKDGDQFYDSGEGVSGVSIDITGAGSYSTTTASAGGYGMPVSSGTYTVKATLSDGSTSQSQVSIGSENTKMDFRLSDFGSGILVVGTSPGLVTKTVSASDQLTFALNITNSAGVAPVNEWLLLTWVSGGIQMPIWAFTNSGTLVDITSSTNLTSATYDFGSATGTFTLGTFSMANLGLSSGDTFMYGYAYSLNDFSAAGIENIVIINIQ